MNTLLRAHRQAEAGGRTLVVAAAPGRLKRLLDRTRLARIMAIYPSVAEAVS